MQDVNDKSGRVDIPSPVMSVIHRPAEASIGKSALFSACTLAPIMGKETRGWVLGEEVLTTACKGNCKDAVVK